MRTGSGSVVYTADQRGERTRGATLTPTPGARPADCSLAPGAGRRQHRRSSVRCMEAASQAPEHTELHYEKKNKEYSQIQRLETEVTPFQTRISTVTLWF